VQYLTKIVYSLALRCLQSTLTKRKWKQGDNPKHVTSRSWCCRVSSVGLHRRSNQNRAATFFL